MCSRTDDDRGSVSALVVCVSAALVLLGLYLHDSSVVIDEYARISDVAGNAARVGAQSVVGIRAGNPHLDTPAAVLTARRFLRDNGVSATVTISGGSVIVEAESEVDMPSMRLLGLGPRHVHTRQAARLVSG